MTALLFVLLFLLPLGLSYAARMIPAADAVPWWQGRRDAAGMAPDPASTPEAVVQVYGARAVGWRGAFGVHTWFAVKPKGADRYTRYEVIGWRALRGGDGLAVNAGPPDGYWFGSKPTLLAERRGPAAEPIAAAVLELAERYPWRREYRIWPGPNSNTFTAWVARQVPELRLDLPAHAIGKDWLGAGIVAPTPSGTGWQLSLYGLLGLAGGLEEGIEVNLLGLNAGLDLARPALRLPGLGRVGME